MLLLIVLCCVTNHGEGTHKKYNSTGVAVAGGHLHPRLAPIVVQIYGLSFYHTEY